MRSIELLFSVLFLNDDNKNVKYSQTYLIKKILCAFSGTGILWLLDCDCEVILWHLKNHFICRGIYFLPRKHLVHLLHNQTQWRWVTLHFQDIFSGNYLGIIKIKKLGSMWHYCVSHYLQSVNNIYFLLLNRGVLYDHAAVNSCNDSWYVLCNNSSVIQELGYAPSQWISKSFK